MSSDYSDENFLQLIGNEEPHVTIRKGPQLWGSAYTKELFKDALWAFHTDGSFLFTPPALPALKKNLRPLAGKYMIKDTVIEFASEQGLAESADISIDGTIYIQGERVILQVIYVMISNSQIVALVHQRLSRYVVAPVYTGTSRDIVVPSIFDVLLQGNVDTYAFQSLSGTLKILPGSSSMDANPFVVELAMQDPQIPGAIYWTSFLNYTRNRGEQISKIEFLAANQIRLTAAHNQNRLSPSWSTLMRFKGHINSLVDMPIGAWAMEGALVFSVLGNTISGDIHAHGYSYADYPGIDLPSIYAARFTGQKKVV